MSPGQQPGALLRSGLGGGTRVVSQEVIGPMRLERRASVVSEAMEGIANTRGHLLGLVLEIAGSVHHLGLHLLGLSLGLHRVITAEGTGGGLQPALRILGCGLDRVLEAHRLVAMESGHHQLAVPLIGS